MSRINRILVGGLVLMALHGTEVRAAPVLWSSGSGGNNHYYDFVLVRLTWDQAATAASAMSYAGYPGHLATITSLAENNFLAATFPAAIPPSSDNAWLGGFQPPGSPEPGGNWKWITGEPFVFTNWDSGEPNNLYSGGLQGGVPLGAPEERLTFHGLPRWNDVPAGATTLGFLVEFEPAAVVPEPTTLTLFGSCLVGLFLAGRRRRTART